MNNINIAFSINNSYVPYWSVCLVSLLLNAKKEDILNITVFSSDISDENKRKIETLQRIKPFTIEYINIDLSLFKQMPNSSQQHITNETNYRFLLSSIKSDLDKCIFLDADLIVIKNIRLLWEQPIDQYYIAAVEDEAACQTNAWVKNLPLPKNYKYVNTGVMLCNLKKWRQDMVEKDFFQNVKKHADVLKFPDQDTLNITFAGYIAYLPPEYNALPVQTYRNETVRKKAFKNPIIIHYAGCRKPWDIPCRPYADIWWEYARQTPFYEELLFKMTEKLIRSAENRLDTKFSNHSSIFFQYYKCKLMSKITWGIKKAGYQQKCTSLHEKVREIRKNKSMP